MYNSLLVGVVVKSKKKNISKIRNWAGCLFNNILYVSHGDSLFSHSPVLSLQYGDQFLISDLL